MKIDKQIKVSDDVLSYLNTIKQPEAEIDKILSLPKASELIKNATTLIAFDDDNNNVIGVLIFKKEQKNKRDYIRIELIDGTKEAQIALVEELISIYQSANYDGIFTRHFSIDRDISSLSQFKLLSSLYLATISSVKSKLKANSAITPVKVTPSNYRTLKRLFTELLTEHDIQRNDYINQTIGRKILPTNLKGLKSHRLKLSYFIDNLAKSKEWQAFILYVDENPIGFVKGKVSSGSDTCFPDLYLKPKFLDRYIDASFLILLNSLKVKYVGGIASRADRTSNNLYEKWFGKKLAEQFFFIR